MQKHTTVVGRNKEEMYALIRKGRIQEAFDLSISYLNDARRRGQHKRASVLLDEARMILVDNVDTVCIMRCEFAKDSDCHSVFAVKRDRVMA